VVVVGGDLQEDL